MTLTLVEKSLILAAYFRGGSQNDGIWTSNSDQIVTLSLYFTVDIPETDCIARFSERFYVGGLYDEEAGTSEQHPWGKLTEEIESRYGELINLLHEHPELIEGRGNFDTPAHPTFTACRLTGAGLQLATTLVRKFPKKPPFPEWPDRRSVPEID